MIGVHRAIARISPAAIHSAGKARAVIIELEPPGNVIGFRLKGTRRTYKLPVDFCFREAVRAELAALKAAKKKAKNAK